MTNSVLVPGDRLQVSKGVVTHCGTYMGNGMVAHNVPGSGPALVPVSGFSRGRDVGVVQKPEVSIELLFARLEEFSRKNKRYGVLTNNCEHLSSVLETGRRHSPQVAGAFAGAACGYAICKGLEVESPVAMTALVVGVAMLGSQLASPKPDHPLVNPV